MNIVVGTATPVLLPVAEASGSVTIQNLGSGNLYVDGDPHVTVSTGLKIGAGASFTIPGPDNIGQPYLISDTAATDVRYLY
jgi:hypothetical protein